MYGDVVFDLGKEPFAEVLDEFKTRRRVERDIDLPADDLTALVHEFKSIIQAKRGAPFPDDPFPQLRGAPEPGFKRWPTPRAHDYRQGNGLPPAPGPRGHVGARA